MLKGRRIGVPIAVAGDESPRSHNDFALALG